MKKILVIRFSSIGDIVLTTPVLRCLKRQLGAEVHYLTKRQYTPLLEGNPHVDRIFTFGKNVWEALPELRRQRYDYVVDLHRNLRTLQVRLGLFFAPKWLAFRKLNVEKWLLTALKINILPKVHIVDRYLAATAPLGIVNDGLGLEFGSSAFGKTATLDCQQLEGYVAFAIGAQQQTKRLPTAKIVELCKGIRQPVVLLGGPAEAVEGALIAERSGEHVRNLCGKLSLQESATMLRNATLVITHDTGMMHIAAALQKRILSIWGNTVPALGMSPYYGTGNPDRNTTFEVEGLPCRPCSKLGHSHCPKGHFRCMNDQNVAAILRVVASENQT